MCVWVGGGVGGINALLRPANFHLGPDVTFNTEKNIKIRFALRLSPQSMHQSENKHKNQSWLTWMNISSCPTSNMHLGKYTVV